MKSIINKLHQFAPLFTRASSYMMKLLDRFIILIIYFVITLPFILGSIYLPTRLFFIGEVRKDTISSFEFIENHDYIGGYYYYSSYYSIVLHDYPELIKMPLGHYKIGQQVNLLYSDRLHYAVIVPNDYNYFSVIYNSSPLRPSFRVTQAVGIIISLSILIPFRSIKLLLHIAKSIGISWRNALRDKSSMVEKVVAITDFFSQFSTICVAVTFVLSFIFLIVKVVLLVEQTGLILTTLTFLLVSTILVLPVLETIVDAIIRIRKNEIVNSLILIIRNLVATAAGGILVYKLVIFMSLEKFKEFENIREVFLELISFLFS